MSLLPHLEAQLAAAAIDAENNAGRDSLGYADLTPACPDCGTTRRDCTATGTYGPRCCDACAQGIRDGYHAHSRRREVDKVRRPQPTTGARGGWRRG